MSSNEYRRQLDAFRNRAFAEGNAEQFHKALHMQRQFEIDAENRALTAAATRRDRQPIIPTSWKVVGGLILALWVASWVYSHMAQTIVLAVLVLVGYVVWRRRPRPRVVQAQVEPVAPPDIRRKDVQETLRAATTAAVHEDVAAALPPAYRAAAEAGQVPYPRTDETEHGEQITVTLPKGVTSSRFNVEAFAGAYDVPQRRVRLVKARTPGLLVIDVLNDDPENLPMPDWPITGKVAPDMFDDVPVGVELSTGNPIATNMLHQRAGAAQCGFFGPQGSGKSLTMRTCAAPAILNPEFHVIVLALKGLAEEWYSIRAALDGYVTTVPEAEKAIRELRHEVEKRQQSRLVGKPILFIIDETEPLKGSAAWGDLEYVVKLGRSLRVGVWVGSQEATKESTGIPTGVIRMLTTVWLGAGTSSVLANAVGMSMKDEELQQACDAGFAWFKGRGVRKTLIRTYYVDEEMPRILGVEADGWDYDEARAAAQGNVHDADSDVQDVLDDEASILDHVLAKIGTDKGIRWPKLAKALDIDEEDLREQLRELGIKSGKWRVGTDTYRGVNREDVIAAMNAD